MAWIKRGLGVVMLATGMVGVGCQPPAAEPVISRMPPGYRPTPSPAAVVPGGSGAVDQSLITPHVEPSVIPVLPPVVRPSSPGTSPSGAPATGPLPAVPVGHVGTWAGSGEEGTDDGLVATARFERPWGVVVDGDGRVVVADDGGDNLRRITPEGRVTTLARGLNQPHGLAIDPRGNLYVADYFNHRVRRVTPSGTVSVVAGASDTGTKDGPVDQARFWHPAAIAVYAPTGSPRPEQHVFIADSHNHRVRRLSPEGAVWPPRPSASPSPSPSQAPSGNLLVHTVAAEGQDLERPFGVAVDSQGQVYVADTEHHRILRYEPVTPDEDEEGEVAFTLRVIAGTGIRGLTDGTGTRAQFSSPMGLAFDRAGNLYVADYYNHAVRKLTPPDASGKTTVSTVAGTGFKGFQDGPRAEARFAHPTAVAADARGNLFVADSENRRIRKIQLVADVP